MRVETTDAIGGVTIKNLESQGQGASQIYFEDEANKKIYL